MSPSSSISRVYLTAFFGGILTLGLEIVAGRVLVPFFGSSLHQWAALIGIVLLAYVIGYETFTKINRWGPSVPFALGGIYVLTLPIWIYPLMDNLLDLPLSVASLGGALLTTGFPSVLWASILPFLQKQKESHRLFSSRVLAFSTAGNLAGVWGIAFIGVPEFGTRNTLIGLGVLSLALAAFWFSQANFKKQKWIPVVLLCLVAGSAYSLAHSVSNSSPEKWGEKYLRRTDTKTEWIQSHDTAYQQIVIWSGQYGQESRRALMLNGNVQFIWKEDEKLTATGSRYEYYNYATAAAYWTSHGAAKNLLTLGIAGGLVPWQIRQFLPNIGLTGYDLDSSLIDLSRAYLPLKNTPNFDIQIGDARFLLRQDQKKYDYILLDCFISGYVPFQLSTLEFFEMAKARIADGGILVANFHTIFAASGLLGKIEKTLSATFKNVAAVDLPSGITLLMASPDPTPFEERFQRATESSPIELKPYSYLAKKFLRTLPPADDSTEGLLSDDKNNTEQLLYETRKHIMVKRIL